MNPINMNPIKMNKISTFDPLNVSSKFAICGLPIRVDTYKTCSFGCKYCFSNYRVIMNFEKTLQVGNVSSVEKRLAKVFAEGYIPQTFLDTLIKNKLTWHCGGMSDPFQPCELKYKVTEGLVNIANKYGISILFSTKSDTVYGCNITPELHTFQLSVTNCEDRRDIEPNVPSIQKRLDFYKALKRDGFRVGIRIQPDPTTGIVRCGCGGKAGFHYSSMMRDNDCYVECGVCGEHSKVALSEEKARDAWNAAMSGAIVPETGEMDPNGDENA